MKWNKRLFPPYLRFLLSVHLILLLIFSVFRFIMLLSNKPAYFFDMERSMSLTKAFRIGLWFDVTIASYAMFVPYLLLTYLHLFRSIYAERVYKYVRFYCGFIILISLVICAADVPYYKYFNARLNIATVHLKNLAQSGSFVLKEVAYYPIIALFVVGLWGIRRLVLILWNRAMNEPDEVGNRQQKMAVAAAFTLLLVGLWGGATPKRPDMKRATFSNDGFINQLTLNPVHTWFDSYFAFDINVVSTKEAIQQVRKAFGLLKPPADSLTSPILHEHQYTGQPLKKNVVLILMESMSANRMGIYGAKEGLTPGLDKLAKNSVLFDRCYSSGIHTNCGIYSTLYGMPVMMMEHPMLNGVSELKSFSGLPVELQKAGYHTRFYCSHPKTFDNLDIFVEKNGFDVIVDQSAYPENKIANSWGVGDEDLLGLAFKQLDSLSVAQPKKPFFATLLTITTHPPYILPAHTTFKPKSKDPVLATYEYADWAISSFIDSCATKPWYNETIFVLVGDHGVNLTNYVSDVPLSYNHVPLIIHAPKLFKKPEVRSGIASQTDIFPTLMGMLRLDYQQNTMGYDLFREKRPFAFFSQDYRMCVLDDKYLYVARKSGRESLYEYKSGKIEDVIERFPGIADSMKIYSCSHLITSKWMIDRGFVSSGARTAR